MTVLKNKYDGQYLEIALEIEEETFWIAMYVDIIFYYQPPDSLMKPIDDFESAISNTVQFF